MLMFQFWLFAKKCADTALGTFHDILHFTSGKSKCVIKSWAQDLALAMGELTGPLSCAKYLALKYLEMPGWHARTLHQSSCRGM